MATLCMKMIWLWLKLFTNIGFFLVNMQYYEIQTNFPISVNYFKEFSSNKSDTYYYSYIKLHEDFCNKTF